MRLPPLNALRVFESAGRLSSFKSAAAELNVTPGAVSKQIKLLEEFLGLALFDRRSQFTVLTEAGATYLEAIGPALRSIAGATARTQATEGEQPLRIWCSPFIMRRWLVPRLSALQARMPGQEIIVDIDLTKKQPLEGCDIGILRGDGRWPGYASRLLFPIRLVPVCSPRYLKGRPPPRTFKDLRDHAILENLARPDEWPIWSGAAGGAGLPGSVLMSFSSSDTVYQAAIEGMGIAIGRIDFIEQQLGDGRLVLASDVVAETGQGYYLVIPTDRPLPRRAQIFQRWLLRQLD